uniref:hypothetical protein n=1 Tax=Eubacterium cellulosolvens TaxID=29322 RepID=UPI00047F12C3|nr:hypothetical protein [[Eubacterium] cellulosolvens]
MNLRWGNYEQLELADYLKETFGCEEDAKETEIKKKDKRNKPCEQRPSDEEIAFFDPACEKLFALLRLTSKDVGFSWPTGMLYDTLLQILIEARGEDSDEELKTASTESVARKNSGKGSKETERKSRRSFPSI